MYIVSWYFLQSSSWQKFHLFATTNDGRIQTAAEYLRSKYKNFDYQSPESFELFDSPVVVAASLGMSRKVACSISIQMMVHAHTLFALLYIMVRSLVRCEHSMLALQAPASPRRQAVQ